MSSGLTLGAQQGPQHRDGSEEEVAATQAAARAVTGEDGLWCFIQGLICGEKGDRLSAGRGSAGPGYALSEVPGLVHTCSC